MAACYSADPDGTVRLPFDTATGELIPESGTGGCSWTRSAWSPDHADDLRSLRAIYIDAGKKDEYYLDLGAEAFRRALERDRRDRCLLRAVRRDAHGDRVPLPAQPEYLAERLST